MDALAVCPIDGPTGPTVERNRMPQLQSASVVTVDPKQQMTEMITCCDAVYYIAWCFLDFFFFIALELEPVV